MVESFGKTSFAAKRKLRKTGYVFLSLCLCEFLSLGLVLHDCSTWLDNSLYEYVPFLKPVLKPHLERKMVDCNAAWAWPQGETLSVEASKAELGERSLKEASFAEKARHQLALAVPAGAGLKEALPSPVAAAVTNQQKDTSLKKELTKVVHKPSVKGAAHGRQITISMPATLEEGLAFFEREMAQLEVIAKKGLRQAGQWTNALSSRLGSNGLITPVSRPYVHSRTPGELASGHRLFYTKDGRLKSFVSR